MENKISIITGASSGIGKALAYELAQRGSNVVLVARRKELIDKISEDINSKYQVKVLAIKADISIEEDCKMFIEKTMNKFGKIDILINNAGISQRAMFADLHLDVIKKVMDVNYWGTVYSTKYALPYILKTKGSIVAVTSISGMQPLPARTGYCASKYAVHGFMDSLRIEHLKTGVHVMIAAPAYVSSEIREHALLSDGSEQGDSPRNEKGMLSAEIVAKRIVKGITKKRRTMLIGNRGIIAIGLARFTPKFMDRLTYYTIKKEENSPY
ncbi:MAG: SDR family oxidoreductase [Bacteroidales bacterium]|nr:SDR family oxidoreductase [Bacteroidales bacterium]